MPGRSMLIGTIHGAPRAEEGDCRTAGLAILKRKKARSFTAHASFAPLAADFARALVLYAGYAKIFR